MATNPLFTVTFDLAGSDDYGAFLAGIRDRLANPSHVSHDRPVLPPVEPGVPPRRWFHVRLTTPASRLTLTTRADNLYLAGFQSSDGTWWELSRRLGGRFRRRDDLIPGSTPLGFAGTYRDLVGGAREVANVDLGRRQMSDAVDSLAARTQMTHAAAAEQRRRRRRLAKGALAVLHLMVHEAIKFLDVAAVVAGLMRPDAAASSGRIGSRDLRLWRYWSSLLLCNDISMYRNSSLYYDASPCENKQLVERAAARVGILLFVQVSRGINAKKALRLFRGDFCGTGSDGAGPDVTFLVAGEAVPAHRYVLAGKSAVFLRQFISHGGGNNRVVEVKDMDAASFKALIHFIYTGSVAEFGRQPRRREEATAAAGVAHQLLAAAHKYELERLKVMCVRELESGAIYFDMAARTLALAEEHKYMRLKAKCIEFIVRTPETLRAVVATEGYKHLEASCPSLLSELLKSMPRRSKSR